MDMGLALLVLAILALLLVLPILAIVRASTAADEVRRLRARLDALERARGPSLEAVPPPLTAAPPEALPAPIPLEPQATPAPVPAAPAPEGERIEQLVGGIWLQNVGSVLVLLGVFFLILWAYTTGRLGAGVLVAAGVALGLALVWRGDRLARIVPRLGHALVGVGLGTSYMALFLGHYTLHVLPAPAALVLLTLASLGTVLVGLHYRAQTVAMLGVIGAFLPQLATGIFDLRGLSLEPGPRLAYHLVVNAAVFALSARAGWGGLNLAALLFTGILWMRPDEVRALGWGLRLGISALFLIVGLAPVPSLVANVRRAPWTRLLVLALAPLLWLAAAWPYLEYVRSASASIVLIVHAIVYLLVALWVDRRRESQDLWRPLTGAATLFLTAALARAVGSDQVATAWCIEGTLLVWIGLGARGWWVRACGYVVAALGGMMLMGAFGQLGNWRPGLLPIAHPDGIRQLVALGALALGAGVLARARPGLPPMEQVISRAWTVALNLLFMWYGAREAQHLGDALAGSGGRWTRAPDVGGPTTFERVRTITAVATSAWWTLQAFVLLGVGWRLRSAFARWLALGLLGLTVLKFVFFDLQHVDVFWRFVTAIAVGVALLGISYAYQRRGKGTGSA
jgi:uncharacterized membrane protein